MRRSDAHPIRIGGAEAAATRCEVREWLDTGKVSVVQPNIRRGGGLTEIRRIADMCELMEGGHSPWLEDRDHLAARSPLPGSLRALAGLSNTSRPRVFNSLLRRELVSPEPDVKEGFMPLPDQPGLGIELNEDLVKRLRTDGNLDFCAL